MNTLEVLDALLYEAEWFALPMGEVPTIWVDQILQSVLDAYGIENSSNNWDQYSWFYLLVREALMQTEYQRQELLLDAQWWFDASIEKWNPMPVNSWTNYLQIEWGWKYVDDRETEMWFDLLIREAIYP